MASRKRRKKKKSIISRFIKLVVVLGIFAGLYFGAMIGVAKLAEKAIPVAVSYADSAGILITDLKYGKINVSLLGGITVENVKAYVQREDGETEAEVLVDANSVGAKLAGPFNFNEIILFVRDARVTPQFSRVGEKLYPSEKLPTITVKNFEILQGAAIGDVKTLVNGIAEQAKSLAKDATNASPFELDSEILVPLEGQTVLLETLVKQVGQEYKVQLDQNGVKAISNTFNKPLYAPEVLIVAENPLRAPRLLQIKRYAEQSAKKKHEENERIPEDAYRHVLWSFLLTKAYGATFAEAVTDAHEIGASDNTELDHEMDYNNNRLGRKYANAGKTEEQLELYVLRDREIISAPGKYRTRSRNR